MVLDDKVKMQINQMRLEGFTKKQVCEQLKLSFPSVNKFWFGDTSKDEKQSQRKYPLKLTRKNISKSTEIIRQQKYIITRIVLSDGKDPEVDNVNSRYILDVLESYWDFRRQNFTMQQSIELTLDKLHFKQQ